MKTTRFQTLRSKEALSYTEIKKQPTIKSLLTEEYDSKESKRMSEISNGYQSNAHLPNKESMQFMHSQYFTPKYTNESNGRSKAKD